MAKCKLSNILKLFGNVVSIVYIEFEDVDTGGRNLILLNKIATRFDTPIFPGSFMGLLSIKQTQFPLRLSWACSMQNFRVLPYPNQ